MMDSFADFFKRTVGILDGRKGVTLALPSPRTRAASEGLTFQETRHGALATVITKEGKDITSLYKSAAETVQTESFINDLSQVIGSPNPTETEDAFVQRAKDAARTLLLKWIGG